MKTGEEFWASGIKKDGKDRHWAGGGPVEVDSDVLDEHLELLTPSVRATTFGTLLAICQRLDLLLEDVIAFPESKRQEFNSIVPGPRSPQG